MFEGIKNRIQALRYGERSRRKKWFIASSSIIFVLILALWAVYAGLLSETQETAHVKNSRIEEFSGVFKNSMQYIREAFTASMQNITRVSQGTESTTTTTTASGILEIFASPTPSVIPLH